MGGVADTTPTTLLDDAVNKLGGGWIGGWYEEPPYPFENVATACEPKLALA